MFLEYRDVFYTFILIEKISEPTSKLINRVF